MSDTTFNMIMHMVFIVLFTLLIFAFHGLIDRINKNEDKIAEISNKINVPCEVQTNHVLWITGHKIVK